MAPDDKPTRAHQELADSLGRMLYGMTPDEAIEKGVCIRCHKKPRFNTEAGKKEYALSGFCEPCFDDEFGDM